MRWRRASVGEIVKAEPQLESPNLTPVTFKPDPGACASSRGRSRRGPDPIPHARGLRMSACEVEDEVRRRRRRRRGVAACCCWGVVDGVDLVRPVSGMPLVLRSLGPDLNARVRRLVAGSCKLWSELPPLLPA